MDIKSIIKRSYPAMCGITEREVVVRADKVSSTIKSLRKAGKKIIGTSYGDTPTKTIWFIGSVGL